ncbi:MAG: phenylalanine--tRNA ligase subunit beta [Candidatus Eremiobacteraeota bacterium]|nr:phenylalanine--tRNA ligase subunit beta [Candidatus Eremiobacteraeota bacterium]
MRVPLAWLREFVELPADPRTVAEYLAQLGFPVESIEERPVITGVVVGKIVELDRHPNADRLQVGKIDVGNGGLLTIATAATNVAQGQTIPVATIGAKLPHLTIERRKMRGLESEGMMISADELALPSEWFEDGIMQLEPDVAPGTNVIEYFRLCEPVLDVEVTSNRVDALSIAGLARELAAALKVPLRLPDLTNPGTLDDGADAPNVTIETPDCHRLVAQRFTNLRIKPAPAWMRMRLALAGQRPINNIVDISNYVMLETGQPLHFYDDARVPNHHLIVRDGRDGEKLITLDDVEHELSPQSLVIATEDGAEGLAGLKGGKHSEVSDDTTSILLESANFTGSRVRRTSAQLAFRTEASSRHEKALAPWLTDIGAARAAQLLVAQGATAYKPHAFGEEPASEPPIMLKLRDIPRILGFDVAPMEIREFLDALGFRITLEAEQSIEVIAPPWRRDVTSAIDVIEEIARLAGYDRIEATIPSIAAHEISSAAYELERRLAQELRSLGYRELVNYALHGPQVFEKLRRAGFEPSRRPVEVMNPLSEDQRYLRYALGPGLLEYFARVDTPARVFEIGHVFYQEAAPTEIPSLMFGFTAEPLDEPPWSDTNFLRVKGDTESLLTAITACRNFEATPDKRNGMHPGKTAAVMLEGHEVAVVGAIDPRVANSFGVRFPVYIGFIFLEKIPEFQTPAFHPPSKFPSTYRDLALLCGLEVPAHAIERCIAHAIGSLARSVRVFDEYRGPQVGEEKKSLAVRTVLQRDDATITDEEADAAMNEALSALRDQLDVTLRG